VPRRVRAVVGVGIVVMAYGTVAHLIQLRAGYPWAPTWLAVYFTSLTLFDPLAAALLWFRRRAGLYLAAGVLATDAAANGYATYVIGAGPPVARASQAVITTLAVAALLASPSLRPHLR
jgi:hypothetical protein